MRSAVIIGDRGQDGRILWDQLAAQGFSLVGISRQGSRSHNTGWDLAADVSSAPQMLRLAAEFRPDQIYYLAACHRSSQDRNQDPAAELPLSLACHVQGLQNVLDAVRHGSPSTRVFYAASSRIFGHADGASLNEQGRIQPACIYGVTKAAGMMLAAYYRSAFSSFVCSGILFNHESSLRGRQFISQRIAHGLAAIKAGRASQLQIGNLEARTDWGYAPDYTRAMQQLLELDAPRDFVIASGATHSVRDMIAATAQALDLSWEGHIVQDAGILQRTPQGLTGDPSLLRRLTGWQPTLSFEGMMALMAQAALQQAGGTAAG